MGHDLAHMAAQIWVVLVRFTVRVCACDELVGSFENPHIGEAKVINQPIAVGNSWGEQLARIHAEHRSRAVASGPLKSSQIC